MTTHLLGDLAVVMATAGATALLFQRLRQPVVLGYIIAGLVIGPFTPPFSFVENLDSIHTMAELGLAFLMFYLGLEFNLPKIRKVGFSAGLAALLEVAGMLVIGFLLGQAFGWNRTNSVFLGAVLCVSSTTIIAKVLLDYKMAQEKFAQVVFGILILEDIVAVAILSLLSGLGAGNQAGAASVVTSFLKIGLFVILFLVLGLLLVPRLLHGVAKFKMKELLGIVTLGLCLSGASVAAYFELSIALGAFLMGAVIAASKEAREVEEWIHPVRDMFSAIFFVSAGMLIQPALLWEYKWPILIVTLVTIVGKVFSGAAGSFLVGYDLKTSFRVGMSLAQIGEFSFVIASLGVALKVTSEFLYPLALAVSSLTTLATPYLIRSSDRLVDRALPFLPPGVRTSLDRYEQKMKSILEKSGRGAATAIFSRYLIRGGIYLALLTGLVLAAQIISGSLTYWIPADSMIRRVGYLLVWGGAAVVSLPVFLLIAKYANHMLLLIVSRSKFLLHVLDVHLFYKVMFRLTVWTLELLFLALTFQFVWDPRLIAAVALFLISMEWVSKKKVRMAQEGIEGILDHITGLATSEPTRQAVLLTGDKKLLLTDITDQVSLPEDSPAGGRTIRSIGIREKTGASIVAIYRNGEHMANPGPDLELQANDVVVLIGQESELAGARALLDPEPGG